MVGGGLQASANIIQGALPDCHASPAGLRRMLRPSLAAITILIALAGAAVHAQTDMPPDILVSRQLAESERLSVGDLVRLATNADGSNPRQFRIAGVYEPTPDPQ